MKKVRIVEAQVDYTPAKGGGSYYYCPFCKKNVVVDAGLNKGDYNYFGPCEHFLENIDAELKIHEDGLYKAIGTIILCDDVDAYFYEADILVEDITDKYKK